MLDKLGKWVSGKDPANIKGTIERGGEQMWNDHNSTFVATLMTSLVTDASNQGKLDAYWAEAVSLGDEAYFEQSMKVLCGLLVSGNMPNFANPPAAPQSSSAGPESSAVSSSSGEAPGPGSSSSEPVQNVSSSSAAGPKTSSSAADAIAAPALLPAESFALHGRVLQLNLHTAAHVNIASVTGVVVKSFRVGANSTSVSLADLPCGTYLIRVQSAGVARIRTFTIK